MYSPEPIDPGSPVPLYHQIAEAIRRRIVTGELQAGEVVQPLREAAEKWGVNLHTVRHAYASLARDGLLEIGRGGAGTRVAATDVGPAATPAAVAGEVERFVEEVVERAGRRFGLSAEALAGLLRSHVAAQAVEAPRVYVVECSAHQCGTHAEEIAARYSVKAIAWPLERGEPPDDGRIVATYFHYNDVRRSWPLRLRGVAFVTIRPDADLRRRLRGVDGPILVCERDEATAQAVIGDLQGLLSDRELEYVEAVTADPAHVLEGASGDSPVLFPPRVWADLPARAREHERAVEIIYRLDGTELDALAVAAGWVRRSMALAG